MNAEALNKLMINRRSVFPQFYTGEKVDDAIIQQMIVNATWAPTHKLTQPWRFIIYSGDGIQQFAKLQAGTYKTVTLRDGSFKEEKYNKLLNKPLLSSHIIVIYMQRDKRQAIPEVEEIGAVFCAVQNMYLTATAYDMGCYLSTGGITYFKEANGVFGMQPEDKLIGFLHVGKPKQQFPPGKRISAEEVSTWITG